MEKKTFGILVMTLLIITALSTFVYTPVKADWNPEDGHKMHYPQLPDPYGWDVYATAKVPSYPDITLADDFKCSETGWIKDIHFWGSWKGDNVGKINYFVIGIAADIPAEDSPTGYSMPGDTLKEWTITNWDTEPIDPPGNQGWYQPYDDIKIENDHQHYYQYNINLAENEWFYQYEGRIYWLFLSAVVQSTTQDPQPLWGWKSSKNHWNDDAVWAKWGDLDWIDMWEPQPGPKINNFWVEISYQNEIIEENSGGTDYYDNEKSYNGWYYYPNTNWWNIWFYDHPFDPERYKDIFISLTAIPTGPESYITVAINWATDLWEGEYPPVPPLEPYEEENGIGRQIIYESYEFYEPITITKDFTIPWYNPEWVSVDVMGSFFIIEQGTIIHECLPKEPEQSLDLAFVITGGKECECELKIEILHGTIIDALPYGLQIGSLKVEISNIGTQNCNNISWTITSTPIFGKVSFNANGVITTLAPSAVNTVTCTPVGRIGYVKVTATATACTKTATDSTYVLVIGPFIIVQI